MEVDSITDEVSSGRTNGDEDPYKSEGQIILKIEKFSEFARERHGSRRLSDPVYIRGLPWRILAAREMSSRPAVGRRQQCQPYMKTRAAKKNQDIFLGYFLQCNHGDADLSWSCSAKATFKILTQKPGEENHVRKITHVFNAKEDDWGFPQFMTFENIMDPEEGWYDEKEDTIILLVNVKADPPHGVKIDDERIKFLQGTKEKENEIQIDNSDGNLVKMKEELEKLKKVKEESDKKLIEKLKENKEIYERLAQNANQLAIINEKNKILMEKLEKDKFLIKQLDSEKLQNLIEYEEEIEKIKSKVENLEREKRCALDFIKIKEKELEEGKKKIEELTILNENLESKFNEVKTENVKLNEKLENQSKGLQQLKDIFGSMDGHMNKKI